MGQVHACRPTKREAISKKGTNELDNIIEESEKIHSYTSKAHDDASEQSGKYEGVSFRKR